jgi:hypothetical protein
MRNTAEQMINTRAAAWTAGVHILLLLLFILTRYGSPTVNPPVHELGMEVNLGTNEEGSGEDQPMNTEEPTITRPVNTYKATAAAIETPDREVLRAEDKDAPAIGRPAKKAQARSIAPTSTARSTQPDTRQANTKPPFHSDRSMYILEA